MASTVDASVQYHARQRRRYQRDFAAFRLLRATPFDLGTASAGDPLPEVFSLPARSRLAVSADEDTVDGDITVNVGSHVYVIPARDADVVFKLPFGERGQEVSVETAATLPASTVTIHVLDEFLRPYAIATGTVS